MQFLRIEHKRRQSCTRLYLHPVFIGRGQRKEVLLVTDTAQVDENDEYPQWCSRATMELDSEQITQIRDWCNEWLNS